MSQNFKLSDCFVINPRKKKEWEYVTAINGNTAEPIILSTKENCLSGRRTNCSKNKSAVIDSTPAKL